MRSFLLRSYDLEGAGEVADGIAILRLRYGQAIMASPCGFILIRRLLKKMYKKTAKSLPGSVSCAVVVEADAELNDLALIRGVMSLWEVVTKNGGRLALIGYPMMTVSGERTPLPPMMPNFGLARDIDSALQWVTQSHVEFEGGETWHNHAGVSRGRSLIPGEKSGG